MMRTRNELNRDILTITMTIADRFPELSKYIGEMPVIISDSLGQEIKSSNLKDYYDSLDAFQEKYSIYSGVHKTTRASQVS